MANKAKFVKKDLQTDPEKNTRDILWEQAQSFHSTVIVTGMHGRKGPKADKTVAGSSVKFLYET